MTQWPVHARFDGPIVLIGLGSIGRGILPLLERHIEFNRTKFTVIDPVDDNRALVDARKMSFIKVALTRENYRDVLTPLLTAGPGRGMVINLSVDTGSADLIEFCQGIGAHYIDTVCEPWPGLYDNPNATHAERTNYALREQVLDVRRRKPGGVTAVSTCGANPGMVSWFVKQALLDVARDTGVKTDVPATRAQWAALAHQLGVKGIHVAERDTQRANAPKPPGVFVNTWSVEGFVAEGLQPAELGWGTHEKALPPEGREHEAGNRAAIYLLRPGAGTRVRSWTPTATSQHAWLITHNEAISVSDYLTVKDGDRVIYRPTCHYAYHPCDDAVLSLNEMAGHAWQRQPTWKILDEKEIVDGIDELGVLLYGHAKNAYWYGSQLSIEEARKLAPYQNATGLQVSSAVLAGIVWMLENPDAGLVDADEIDFRRCLEIQRPYLGPITGVYTDWTPLTDRPGLFAEAIDTSDPWQFANVIVR